MLKFKVGRKNEIAVRVFIESNLYGREYFDAHDSLEDCAAAIARLTASALQETQVDGVARQVGIAIVPKSEYGWSDGYGEGLEAD